MKGYLLCAAWCSHDDSDALYVLFLGVYAMLRYVTLCFWHFALYLDSMVFWGKVEISLVTWQCICVCFRYVLMRSCADIDGLAIDAEIDDTIFICVMKGLRDLEYSAHAMFTMICGLQTNEAAGSKRKRHPFHAYQRLYTIP